ncbi:hypothetical protein [Secundilactobacillus collinoides]|uniref:hypothetical protein n=1 Tax=Secundilactobacillus collinoides TaxID=33960 RepID=UPI000A905752|nr:hypothetical protein [Secundilactobacillus collinoides]
MEETIKLDEQQIMTDFNYLHTRGETAFNETNTTAYLAKRLDEMGVSYDRFDDMTGLIATIGDGTKPIIGMRTDIDALKQDYQAKRRCCTPAGTILTCRSCSPLRPTLQPIRTRFPAR